MTDPPAKAPAAWVLRLTVWLALASGFADLLMLGVKKYGFRTPTLLDPQVVWMGPLAYLIFFVPFGVLLLLFSRVLPRLATPRVMALLLVFVGAFSALNQLYIEVKQIAMFALAAGVAYQASGAIARRAEAFDRMARRSLAALVGVVLLMAAGLNGSRMLAERRAVTALPAARAGAPNVLLLIIDTGRALSMGIYGYGRPTTPAIDSLARTAVVYEKAVSPSSWTQPSHASLFTGYYPHEITYDWGSALADTLPTLAEVMRRHGYRTAGFMANSRYLSREMGLSRGFIRYEDYETGSFEAVMRVTWLGRFFFLMQGGIGRRWQRDILARKWAPDVIDPLLAWISEPRTRPFFAALNFMDVHGPYRPPEPYRSRFREAYPVPPTPDSASPEERRALAAERGRNNYDASYAYLDREIGRLFTELEQRGLLDSTIVILTSDHGEEFNEHGITDHGASLYWPVVNVPLIVWFEGRAPAGLRVREAVSLRGIPRTVADLTGIVDAPFPGVSLARYWQAGGWSAGEGALTELHVTPAMPPGRPGPINNGDLHAYVMGSYAYIRNGDGSEELYQVEADPFERRNLVGETPDSVLAPFRRAIDAIPRRPPSGRRRAS